MQRMSLAAILIYGQSMQNKGQKMLIEKGYFTEYSALIPEKAGMFVFAMNAIPTEMT